MPESRDYSYTPSQVTPLVNTVDRVSLDINRLVNGLGQAAIGGSDVVKQVSDNQNKDLETFIKYKGASDLAKKELGIAQDRTKINHEQQVQEQISSIVQWDEKIKQLDRIGMIAYANGRSKDELANMLKENPGIIDPQTMVDYKTMIAKKLAQQDSVAIIDSINTDSQKIDAPQKTIQQRVSDVINNRQFSDDDQKRSYLETLLPLTINKNEELLKQRWETQRADIGTTIGNTLSNDIQNMINNNDTSTLKKDGFDNILNSYMTDMKKYFPEKSDAELRQMAFLHASDTLIGQDSSIDPLKAKKALESLQKSYGVNAPTQTKAFLSGAMQTARVKVDNLYAQFRSKISEQLDAAKTPEDLNNMLFQVKGMLNNGSIDSANYAYVTEKAKEKMLAFKSLASSQISQDISGIETRAAVNTIASKIDEYSNNDMVTSDMVSKLKAELTAKNTSLQYNFQVNDKVAGVPGSETISFGKEHFPQIDKLANARLNIPGLTQQDVYKWTVNTFGTLTDNQLKVLNNAANSSDSSGQALSNAISTVNALPPEYVNKMMAQKDGLDGKFAAMLSMNKMTGIDTALLSKDVASALPVAYTDAEKQIIDWRTTGLRPFGTMVEAGFRNLAKRWTIGLFDNPIQMDTATSNAIKNVYLYNYAALYSASNGMGNPIDMAKMAQSKTENFIGTLPLVDFGHERILLSGMSPIDTNQVKQYGDIVAASKDYISNKFNMSLDNMKLDMNNVQYDSDRKNIIFTIKDAESLRDFATITLPTDPTEINKVNKLLQTIPSKQIAGESTFLKGDLSSLSKYVNIINKK